MSDPSLKPPTFMTEAEYLELGESDYRQELLDGELTVSFANNAHNRICLRLLFALTPAAEAKDLEVMLGARLRLTSMRYVIPDLAVGKFVREGSKNAPTDVTLVVEITSPGNAATDRNRKKRYYAEAGIKWYLLVEPNFADYRSTTLILFRLEGGKYVEHAVAKPGETLVTNVSFPIEISTDDLVGF